MEAESFIPLPVDQVYLDWQKIGAANGKLSILLIASPREFVDGYLPLLDDAGIKLGSVVSDIDGVCARQMVEGLIAGVPA